MNGKGRRRKKTEIESGELEVGENREEMRMEGRESLKEQLCTPSNSPPLPTPVVFRPVVWALRVSKVESGGESQKEERSNNKTEGGNRK